MVKSFSLLKFKRGATPIILALLLISTFLLLVIFGPGIGDRLGFLGRQKEAEQVSRAETRPNDFWFRLGDQWALERIRAPAAWDITTGSPSVVIAVVSTGVDPEHRDVGANLVPGINTYPPGGSTDEDLDLLVRNGNGTPLAGI